MNTKIVILDFDGTIADTQSLILRTIQDVVNQMHLPARTNAECAATIGLPLEKAFTALYPKMSDEMGEECASVYRQIFTLNNVRGAVKMFPGVKETLQKLYKNGIFLSIATSRHRESVEDFLDEFGIFKYFSYIVSSSDVVNAKPDPEAVLKTLDYFSLLPDSALVVGDTHYDILMGRNAGASTCGVTYGNGKREDLVSAKADFIVNSFAEIIPLLSL